MDKTKKSYTEEWFTHTPTVWQDSLKGVPDFDIAKFKHYLIESREKSFDKDRVRAYKSLKAFKYFEEGFVQRLRHSECDDDGLKLYLIHAKVLASYQGKAYQTWPSVRTPADRSEELVHVAGRGEACSHIAAILFAIEDYIAKGLNQLPDDRSCTDRLCAWNVPSKQNVEPDTIHEIRIVKTMRQRFLENKFRIGGTFFPPFCECSILQKICGCQFVSDRPGRKNKDSIDYVPTLNLPTLRATVSNRRQPQTSEKSRQWSDAVIAALPRGTRQKLVFHEVQSVGQEIEID